MSDRVLQQIRQHPLNHADVCANLREVGREISGDALIPRQGRQLQLLDDVLREFRQREALEHGLHRAELHLRQFKQLTREMSDRSALRQG